MSNREGLRRLPSVLNIATSKLETEAAIESMEREVHGLFDAPVPIEDWEVVIGKIRSDEARGIIFVVCVGALWSLPCRIHFANWGAAVADPRMPKDVVQVHFVDHEMRRGSSICSGVPIGLPVTVVYYNGKPIKFAENSSPNNNNNSTNGSGAVTTTTTTTTSSSNSSKSGGGGVGGDEAGDGSNCVVRMFSVEDCITLVLAVRDRVPAATTTTATTTTTTSTSTIPTATAVLPSSGSSGGSSGGVSGVNVGAKQRQTTLAVAAAAIVVAGKTTPRAGQGVKGKQPQARVSATSSFTTLPLLSDEEVVVRLNF